MTVPRPQGRQQPGPFTWQHQPLGWHWEWVRPEAVAYHRMQRVLPNYRWWRPLLTVTLGGIFYLVLSVLVFLIYGLALASNARSSGLGLELDALAEMRITDPMTLSLLLISVILMAPALLLACLATGLRPWRHMLSVASRIRWRWLLWCVMPATLTFLGTQLLMSAFSLVGMLTDHALEGGGAAGTSADALAGWVGWPTFLVLVAIIVLLVPIQAATEELVFRGLLLQTMGGWVRRPWIAAIPSVLLFTAGHGYGFWGQLSILAFAVTTVVLTIYTGGLEAAIALHVVNNVFIFLVQSTGLTGDASIDGGADTPIVLFQELILCAAYLFWVLDQAKRRRIDNRCHQAAYPVPVWDGLPAPEPAPIVVSASASSQTSEYTGRSDAQTLSADQRAQQTVSAPEHRDSTSRS